jgi:hypothetical protein
VAYERTGLSASVKLEETRLGNIAKALRDVGLDALALSLLAARARILGVRAGAWDAVGGGQIAAPT